MNDLEATLDRIAADTGFSGAVRVDRDGQAEVAKAYGHADRAFGVLNTLGTRFGIASATKGLTALTVVSLIEEGRLTLETTARSILGADLPLIADEVTVEHLLAHRSGIGDYIDEDDDLDLSDYLMPVPVHELDTSEGYLPVLHGHPAKFAPGERFSYCNSGYVVLALLAERAADRPFHELVVERVCVPADMEHSGFLRSDELDHSAARGYLSRDGLRTNVLHLPVRGSGDGGLYTTVGDVHLLWEAFSTGRIVSSEWARRMVHAQSDAPVQEMRYGLGFWLRPSGSGIVLEGCDAGVSFRSVHDPDAGVTHTVVSNTSDGAWPLVRHLDGLF